MKVSHFGANAVAQKANPPPVVPASHVGDGWSLSYSTSHSTPFLWPRKTVEDDSNFWTLPHMGEPDEAPACWL